MTPKPGDLYTVPREAQMTAAPDACEEVVEAKRQLVAAWDQIDKLSREVKLYKPYAQAVRRILRRFDDDRLGSMEAFISICGVRFDGEIE